MIAEVINSKNYNKFASYIPSLFINSMNTGRIFAIGYIDNYYEDEVIGTILLRQNGNWLEIVWYELAENYRRSDYMTYIFEEIIRKFKRDGSFTGIYADLVCLDKDKRRDFFEDLHFVIEETEEGAYDIPATDLLENKLLHSAFKRENTVYLSEASDALKKSLIAEIEKDERDVPFAVPVKWENYSAEKSCIFVANDVPKGLLLVKSAQKYEILSCAWATHPTALPVLLAAAMKVLEERKETEKTIIIPTLNKTTEKLVEKMVPTANRGTILQASYKFSKPQYLDLEAFLSEE